MKKKYIVSYYVNIGVEVEEHEGEDQLDVYSNIIDAANERFMNETEDLMKNSPCKVTPYTEK